MTRVDNAFVQCTNSVQHLGLLLSSKFTPGIKRKIKHKTLAHLFNLFGCQRIFICTCPYNLLRESRKKRVNHALCNLQIWQQIFTKEKKQTKQYTAHHILVHAQVQWVVNSKLFTIQCTCKWYNMGKVHTCML